MMALFVVLLMACCLALGYILGKMNARPIQSASPGATFTASLASDKGQVADFWPPRCTVCGVPYGEHCDAGLHG